MLKGKLVRLSVIGGTVTLSSEALLCEGREGGASNDLAYAAYRLSDAAFRLTEAA